MKWYRLAAAQGEAKAQYNLGGMYDTGRGVPQDDVEAYKWFEISAASTNLKSLYDFAVQARDIVAARMTPAQITEAQKLAREWKKQ